MGAARKSITSPEGLTANRPPVRYGAPAAVALRAQATASAAAPSRCETLQVAATGADLEIQRRAFHPEPSDRVGQRCVRRLSILGSRGGSTHACRLPGSARPKVDGARPDDAPVTLASVVGVAVAAAVAFLLALVIYCA